MSEQDDRLAELDRIYSERILAGDREVLGGIIAALNQQLACFIAVAEATTPSEVTALLHEFNAARRAGDLLVLQLLGMQGGLGTSPDGMIAKLKDPETGMSMSIRLEKSLDLGVSGKGEGKE